MSIHVTWSLACYIKFSNKNAIFPLSLNPHTDGQQRLDRGRSAVLDFLKADAEQYLVVFNSGTVMEYLVVFN